MTSIVSLYFRFGCLEPHAFPGQHNSIGVHSSGGHGCLQWQGVYAWFEIAPMVIVVRFHGMIGWFLNKWRIPSRRHGLQYKNGHSWLAWFGDHDLGNLHLTTEAQQLQHPRRPITKAVAGDRRPEIGGRRSAAGDRRPEIGGRWESISLNQVTSILQLIFFTQLRTGTESFIGNCSGHLYFEMQLQPKGRRCDTDKLIWYAGLCVFYHFESYSCKSRRKKMPVLHWFKVQAMVQTMVDRSATICVFQ